LRRILVVTPVFASEPDAPTLAQRQAEAFPALTRLFVAVLRQRLANETPEHA
jgi:hypothetical protein